MIRHSPGGSCFRPALFLACLYYNDFYDLTVVSSGREVVIRVLQAAGAASILLALIYLVLPVLRLDHGAFFPSLFLLVAAILAWRFAFNLLIHSPQLVENILIVGTGPVAVALARQIAQQQDFAYRLVGFAGHEVPAAAAAGLSARDW